MKTILIETPNYHKHVSVASAQEAVDWLISHNGDAPETAQVLLLALKSAVMETK